MMNTAVAAMITPINEVNRPSIGICGIGICDTFASSWNKSLLNMAFIKVVYLAVIFAEFKVASQCRFLLRFVIFDRFYYRAKMRFDMKTAAQQLSDEPGCL